MPQAEELKQLREESGRLKLMADLSLDKAALQLVIRKTAGACSEECRLASCAGFLPPKFGGVVLRAIAPGALAGLSMVCALALLGSITVGFADPSLLSVRLLSFPVILALALSGTVTGILAALLRQRARAPRLIGLIAGGICSYFLAISAGAEIAYLTRHFAKGTW